MKKFSVITRLLLITRKLKRNGFVTSDKLLDFVNHEMRIRGEYDDISQRTLQRDFILIKDTFGIEIAHKKGVGHYISEEYTDPYSYYDTLLNDFDMLCAFNADTGNDKYILPEHHRPLGNKFLPELIYATKEAIHIEFDYTLVRHNNKVTHKCLKPYFLKESNQRWYVIGYDGDILKSFGVERIQNLVLKRNNKFKRKEIKADELFKDCYGIWSQTDVPVEDIELEYSALDGAFLKTLPLHRSQTIIYEDENTIRIRLKLKVTNDFVMELLSRSNSLKVIKPETLRLRIKNIYTEALKRNS